MLNKIDRVLDIAETIICGIICVAMLVVTCMIVIWRYILVSPGRRGRTLSDVLVRILGLCNGGKA